jgi:hypothetical protein
MTPWGFLSSLGLSPRLDSNQQFWPYQDHALPIKPRDAWNGAEQNRTAIACLQSKRSTIKLQPLILKHVRPAGLEPTMPLQTTD